ncbi:GDSL esterase/lipase [Melia azedarach]|uniref:GDSL esterase/lipase n=1 Tax=Melia azedarach TaxID=155640 RepID=A0ACC1Y5P8_MELAZ|nr:GDSL esterase/lipase [Melia azedarach]
MERRSEIWHLVTMVFMILSWSSLVINGEQKVPCYFIFGDSLYDNGNNNDLDTKAKANYPPYGIDFPAGPTGRFTNGRNTADIIAELLGFEEYIQSFASASGSDILKGVNYASGGAGIRDETASKNLGTVISMNKQLVNHQTTISDIVKIFGDEKKAKEHLRKCIYTVGIGSNDYINNYLLPQLYSTSRLYTPEQYATLLVQQYSHQLQSLYKKGARKVALFGIGPLGCTPGNIATYGRNGSLCIDFVNNEVQLFNTKLKTLVDDLNEKFQDAKFIYVNVFGISSAPLVGLHGLAVNNTPCCKVENIGHNNGVLTCIPHSTPCSIRFVHLFWDATHPTEAANLIVAGRAYVSLLPMDTHPMGIRRLARLNLKNGME